MVLISKSIVTGTMKLSFQTTRKILRNISSLNRSSCKRTSLPSAQRKILDSVDRVDILQITLNKDTANIFNVANITTTESKFKLHCY